MIATTIYFLSKNISLLNVANNWIILKSWHNNMYGTKWSNLIYFLVFWLQITVRTVVLCIVYEPVSRNIKQIYEHSNIYKIKRQNPFLKGFCDTKKLQGYAYFDNVLRMFSDSLKHACWKEALWSTVSR